MSEKRQFRAIKGTRDILPPDSALWNHVEQTARDVFETYGFRDIRTPIFEDTSLFARSVGEETDIVSKEMYTFADSEKEQSFVPQSLRDIVQDKGQIDQARQYGDIARSNEKNKVLSELEIAYQGLLETQRRMDSGFPVTEEFLSSLADYLKYRSQLGLKISLRPEATASVVRAYIEHGMQTCRAM